MAKYYQSPRWTSEFTFCSTPMTFDQYSICSFRCAYCLSQFQRFYFDSYHKREVHQVNVQAVKRLFLGKTKSPFSKYIKARKRMQWGGLSDPFCWIERERGVGLELLRFFREIDYPLYIATKGVWWLDDPRYTELLKDNKSWKFRVAISTFDKSKALRLERGVATPEKRLKAIEKINSLNCGGAILRLRPFIFGISDLTYRELIKAGIDCGIKGLSLGFFCNDISISKENLAIINRLAGFDVMKFYIKYSPGGASPYRLNRKIKRKFVDEVEGICQDSGVKFSVGDRHFKERNHTDFDNYDETHCSGQFAYAASFCRAKGRVRWRDIEKDMEHLVGVRYSGINHEKAERRARFHSFDLKDYMHYLWNNPKEYCSPYRLFEGVLKPARLDSDGNVVYKFNTERA